MSCVREPRGATNLEVQDAELQSSFAFVPWLGISAVSDGALALTHWLFALTLCAAAVCCCAGLADPIPPEERTLSQEFDEMVRMHAH